MKGNKSAVRLLYTAAIFIASAVILCAVFASLLAPYDPSAVSPEEILEHSSAAHWLWNRRPGKRHSFTGHLWRPVFVAFAFCSAFCTMALGLSLGMVSGYFGGLADKSVQCLVALFQGLPGTSLMIAIAAILPENDFRIIIALTLTSWTGFSRIVRNEVLRIKGETYMEGIRSIGAGHRYILRKYIFPNLLPVLIVLFTLRTGTSLLSASALSYLGLGVSPPTADWGVMISDARTYFRSYPLMILAPGMGITPVLSID
ncbi:MAG: ABC transporter permease [Dialister invisus]|uniref:ABC transporter permease n=1 Tax=Dialister invisus TaxID=218538 RepID=UPI0039960876